MYGATFMQIIKGAIGREKNDFQGKEQKTDRTNQSQVDLSPGLLNSQGEEKYNGSGDVTVSIVDE